MANADYLRNVVQYSRSVQIGNEAATVAAFLSALTAYLPPEHTQSHILTGMHSSGKSKVQATAFAALPHSEYLHYSASSNKGLIDDQDLQQGNKRILRLQELEKLSDTNETVEILKSLIEFDGEYTEQGMPVGYEYTRSMKGEGSKKIVLPVCAASITTAKQSIEESFLSRAIEIPVDESKRLNEAVCKLHFGQRTVRYEGIDYHLREDTALRNRIRDHVRNLPSVDGFENIEGAPELLINLVDTDVSESRRHSKIISSLLFASALLNHQNRTIESKGLNDVIHVNAQDIYNIFALRDIISTMVYHIDPIDMQMLRLLPQDMGDMSTKELHAEMRQGDYSISAKSTVRRRLNELEEKGLVQHHSGDDGKLWQRTELTLDTSTVDLDAIVQQADEPIVCPITGDEYRDLEHALEHIARSEQKQQTLFDV